MAVYEQQEKSSPDTSGTGIASVAQRLGFNGADEDPQAKAIQERLERLNTELNKPYTPEAVHKEARPPLAADPETGKAVDKLEMLMQSMQEGNGAEDPEMKQLSGLLQSIQEIQNPELAKLKYQAKDAKVAKPDSQFRAIPAIIDGDQKAVQGSVIKLKLLDSLIVGGQVIPKGHNIYGLGSFSNQRLNLEIKNIRLGNLIVPVNLTVFDQRDAMIGINAPEAVLSDAVNNGVVNAAGSVSLPGFDLTTQLAGAGIDAARSLLSKKLKRIKQPLKSGYPLLLRDNTRKPVK
ncbi:MAG TPA: conjugative transposon protein TraM [Mucilaginibacter sp.]|nr:conjugative transposon protein TraM [Mucilaginibacter sp.]